MTLRISSKLRVWVVGATLLSSGVRSFSQPTTAAVAGFEAYRRGVETRLAREHGAASGFVAGVCAGSEGAARVRRGESIVEQLTAAGGAALTGALLHDWRGTTFVPGAKAADFEQLLKDFAGYPKTFAPQVLAAKLTGGGGDHLQATMRVRQRHVITVVLDSAYDVAYGRLDAAHGYSASRSTRVAEIEGAGTAHERALTASEEHGFLWRLNTYWTYAEGDGGLYIQVESVSLTRAIPRGLGWAVEPYVESVPRESMEFTLRAVCAALRR